MTATAERRPARSTEPAPLPQLSLAGILGVWAAAALPMAALAWLAAPRVAGWLHGPTALPRALILALIAGLAWQCALTLVLVHREQGTLRWSVLKDALWLRAPRRPRTGRRGGLAWLVLIPMIVALGAEELVPSLPTPAPRDLQLFLGSATGQGFLSGNWAWLAIIVVLQVFNSVLGEELLFRGLLLPRMNGRFGRWDWLANGVLFALYHLHVPWVIPQALLDTFILAYPARRYRSALIGILAHSAQSVLFTVLAVAVVLR